jgi:hypothetical protein
MSEVNHERLLRAIRCLQLIQRTNAPKSSIFKAASRALAPLMVEQATMPPLPGKPPRQAQNFIPPAPQDVGRPPTNNSATSAGNSDPSAGTG